MKSLMVLIMLVSVPALAYQSCKEVVDCKQAKKKLTKEEAACFQPKTKIVVVEKPVEKVVVIEKTIVVEKERRKNSLALLAIATPNKLSVVSSGSSFKANTNYQPDLGVMYQRDLSESFRASAGVSLQGNALLGLGYNF